MYKVFIDEKVLFLSTELPDYNLPPDVAFINCTNTTITDETIISYLRDVTLKKLLLINTLNFDLLLKQFNSVFKHIIAGGGIVRCKDSSILFIFRNGKWDLPKGKPGKNENIEQTAIREVEEETGINGVKIIKLAGITRHAYIENEELCLKTSYWFEMKIEGIPLLVPQVSEGITEARWVGKKDVWQIMEGAYSSIRELVEDYLTI